MKLDRSKSWWLAKAGREGDATIGAGRLARDSEPEEDLSAPVAAAIEETRIAFGRFIQLMRRRRGSSVGRFSG
jgi:hypothetical protein